MAGKRITRKAKRFGAILRAARKRKGWSQGELALKVRRSAPNISAYENGKELPRLEILLVLADILDLEVLVPKATSLKRQKVIITGYDVTVEPLTSR